MGSINNKKKNKISAVYITPLKALNRDIFRRVIHYAEAEGLTVSIRHGDTTRAEKQKITKEPPDVLITTPETLGIMIGNKSTREILDGKDCIVSRITDKNGNTRISQIEYPLIYASDPEVVEHDKQVAKWLDKIDEDPQWLKEYKEKKNEHNAIRKRNT